MKIGIDARWIFPEITGIGSYTQELIRHLAQVDAENEYVLYFQSDAVCERTVSYAQLNGSAQWRMQIIPYGPFDPRSQVLMPCHFQRDGLDLYHSTNFMIPFSSFPRGHKKRVTGVVTIHDLIPLLFPEHTPRALKSRFHPVYRYIMREIGKRADGIITVSEASRRDIVNHLSIPSDRADRVVAIYEGVADRYTPGPKPAESEPPTILYVGRMDPYKNVPLLLSAFAALVRERGIEARLKIIGPRDERYPAVQNLIARDGLASLVDWPGYVSGEALLRAYQEAAVFVLPSLYEGFGLPVLEAMASGTPVICSNRASLPEVAGDAALVIDPDEPDSVVNALHHVLTEPDQAETLRVRGLARAARFTWQETARGTLAAYSKFLSDT